MSIDDLTNRQLVPNEIDFDTDATGDLHAWHGLVCRLPDLMSVEEHRRSAWRLVDWYEQVFERADYAIDPPSDGLDALIDELVLVSVPYDAHAELARARWAIRAGEELVKWRHQLQTSGPGSTAMGPATDRLELALKEARNHVQRSS